MEDDSALETAVSRLLRLPEVLELVLLNLPQHDLLLAQRISLGFRQTIQHSICLQRALFLAPAKADDRNDAVDDLDRFTRQKPLNNRLLLRAFPGCYPTVTLAINNDLPTTDDLALGRPGTERWSWDLCISFPADRMPTHHPAVDYPEASWRRMFMSQPPCTNLHLMRRWHRAANPAIIRDGGITMGDFVIEVTRPQTGWHKSYISSDMDWHFQCTIAR